VHCKSEKQAFWLKYVIARRLAQCHLELHPEKTKIVYCKDNDRTGNYLHESFDFLGFAFRPQGAMIYTGNYFVGFLPAKLFAGLTREDGDDRQGQIFEVLANFKR
jgi:RNA-directed DNA polymerase